MRHLPVAKRLLLGSGLLALSAAFLSAAGWALPVQESTLAPTRKQARTSEAILRNLEQYHYRNVEIDDRLSSEFYDRYIEYLDPWHAYFLASDLREFEKYRLELDDAVRENDVRVAFEIFQRFHTRWTARLEWILGVLNEGLDEFRFDVDEWLEYDRENAPFPATQEEADDLWRRRVKDDVLGLRLAGKSMDEIRDLLKKRYENQLLRANQLNGGDVFSIYMRAFTQGWDPHTSYFPPRDAENFQIEMSLKLEGIGALLGTEGLHTVIRSLVPGGPAERGKELAVSDKIISVAQGDEEPVDIVGWRLDDVVDMIRGAKGSVVKLGVLGSEQNDVASARTVELVRDEIKLEDQAAQSEVMEVERDGHKYRVGLIELDSFYMDFEAYHNNDPDYRSSTRDVAKLLKEFTDENIDGVVLDLRGNGGGSLIEAQELTGLFVGERPVVQVRDPIDRRRVLWNETGAVWEGPLVVMVDRASASASEIFAGAIQDYGRGVVVGSRTFGKGTVQTVVPVTDGQLKLTQAKFYRISGSSTQRHGVEPDVLLPSIYDEEEVGESALDEALPWDQIDRVKVQPIADLAPLLPGLVRGHEKRLASDPLFHWMKDRLTYTLEGVVTRVSLNEETRKARRAEEESERLALENERRAALGEEPVESLEDVTHSGTFQEDIDKIFRDEASQVLVDLVQSGLKPELGAR